MALSDETNITPASDGKGRREIMGKVVVVAVVAAVAVIAGIVVKKKKEK